MPSPTDKAPTELIPAEPAAAASTTPKWDKVEQERLTRRAALRKMGYTSGIALFSMFAVDDLARMAIKKMEQHKETRQIAETVAKEFKNAGIALAGGPSWLSYCDTCTDPCVAPKYYKCTPCIYPCIGQSPTAKVNCDTYTVPGNNNDCLVCCGIQWPVDNLLGLAEWKICTATC